MKPENCRRCMHMSYGKHGETDYGRMRCMVGNDGVEDCAVFAPRRVRNLAPCKPCTDKDVPSCRSSCPEWGFYVEEKARRSYERTVGMSADGFLHEGIRRRMKARGMR